MTETQLPSEPARDRGLFSAVFRAIDSAAILAAATGVLYLIGRETSSNIDNYYQSPISSWTSDSIDNIYLGARVCLELAWWPLDHPIAVLAFLPASAVWYFRRRLKTPLAFLLRGPPRILFIYFAILGLVALFNNAIDEVAHKAASATRDHPVGLKIYIANPTDEFKHGYAYGTFLGRGRHGFVLYANHDGNKTYYVVPDSEARVLRFTTGKVNEGDASDGENSPK